MAGTVVPAPVIRHRSRGVVRLAGALSCDAAGVLTATPLGEAWGLLRGVLYDGGLDIGATVTISDAKTGAALVTYTTGTEDTPVFFQPTQVIVDTAGASVTAATTAADVNRPIFVGGRINVAVTGGGTSEHGKIALVVDEALLGHPLAQAN